MKDFQFTYNVHSPRWGHRDEYFVIFRKSGIEVGNQNFRGKYALDDDGGWHWSGYGNEAGYTNECPLIKIMHNDGIPVPEVVQTCLEESFERWQDGRITNEKLGAEFITLFHWIDDLSRNKPGGEFWNGIF